MADKGNFTSLTAQTTINTILKKSNVGVNFFLYVFKFFMVIHRMRVKSNTVGLESDTIVERLIKKYF